MSAAKANGRECNELACAYALSCRCSVVLALAGCGSSGPQRAPIRATPFVDYLKRGDASLIAYTPSSVDVDRELKLLRSRFDGLILYGLDEKTPSIPECAARLKYRAVLATVWDPRSDAEIGDAARLLNRYPDPFAVCATASRILRYGTLKSPSVPPGEPTRSAPMEGSAAEHGEIHVTFGVADYCAGSFCRCREKRST